MPSQSLQPPKRLYCQPKLSVVHLGALQPPNPSAAALTVAAAFQVPLTVAAALRAPCSPAVAVVAPQYIIRNFCMFVIDVKIVTVICVSAATEVNWVILIIVV